MARAVRFHETGGPEVLRLETLDAGVPKAGEVRLRHRAVGVNFIDCYHRSGLYPVTLPSGIGLEGAGEIEAVGSAVADFSCGDRVAYMTGPIGAYADIRILPAEKLVRLPAEIDFETAAAAMLKGCTVEYLVRRTYPVAPGTRALLHAAAGGVGLIAVQWLKALGAFVIGTAGSEDKAALARRHGCDAVILYRQEDVAARVTEITGGTGVDVVYDGVGRDTFTASLDSLRPRGLLVSFGNASGPVRGVDLSILQEKGSLYLTRPTLTHYYADRREREEGSRALFDRLCAGDIQVEVARRLPLEAAAEAHRALEAGETTGSTILVP